MPTKKSFHSLSLSRDCHRGLKKWVEMGRGNNDTDGASANSTRVLSPDTLDSRTSQLSQPISRENKGVINKDLMLKLCANGIEILKLAQTVEELHAAIFTVQVDNDQLKREVAKANKRERERKKS